MTPDQWNAALDNYRREEAAYANVAVEYEAACRAYDSERPDAPEEFTTYGLTDTISIDRDELIRRTELRIVVNDYVEGNPDREPLTAQERGAVAVKATRLVDAFAEWRQQAREVELRIYAPAEKKHDAACDKIWEARNKLLNTPAPDAQAMLFKVDILARLMSESLEQDAPAVALIRDDAHRLFGEA